LAKSVEGVGEAVNSDANSDLKQLARQLLSEGLDVDAVAEESGLSKMVVLGISGAMKKAQKKLEATEDKAAKSSPSENVGEEEISLDLKKEAQITNQAVALARSQQRLKSLDPKSEFLHGGQQQPEGSSTSKTLADVELAQYIRSLRETTGHPNNNGDSQGLQKQINDLREQLHQKDLEALQKQSDKLEAEIQGLREDVRHSTNGGSDLAVVVRETSNLIGKALESPGVIRSYLVPDGINIGKKADAPPLLRAQPVEAGNNVLEVLKKHGLVTKVVER
jgi:hypothetical protein